MTKTSITKMKEKVKLTSITIRKEKVILTSITKMKEKVKLTSITNRARVVPYEIVDVTNMPSQTVQFHKRFVTFRTLIVSSLFVYCFYVSYQVITSTVGSWD